MGTFSRAVLGSIDARLPYTSPSDIPRLLSPLSLEVWGKLLLDMPSEYLSMKAFFPSMPSDEVQDSWTGAHGMTLMAQSIAFMASLTEGYVQLTGHSLEERRVLDFGCGWGRLIRLLYKYVSHDNIYAVDPWDQSIALCREHGVKAHLALSDYVPNSLPFELKFDMIYAFSVFTHLSEKTNRVVLNTLSRYITDDGVLVLTIRPPEYWHHHLRGAYAEPMLAKHAETGYASMPHDRPPIDGDITYGDTSMSLDYLTANFPQWRQTSSFINAIDPHQRIVFLRPV